MNCVRCGTQMADALTTFTMVKDGQVYMVESVPCLECATCEETAFALDVAAKLEKYCSGRVLPTRATNAWVYRWDTPVLEILGDETILSTETTLPLFNAEGTEHGEATPRYEGITSPSNV